MNLPRSISSYLESLLVSAWGIQTLTLLSGYCHADHGIQDYLTILGSKDVAYSHAGAFLRHY